MILLSKMHRRFASKESFVFLVFIASISYIIIYIHMIQFSSYYVLNSANYTSKYPYIALIVDDRATKLLVNAVINVLQHIPKDWKVQIITLEENWPFYRRSRLASLMKKGRVFLTSFDEPRAGLTGDEMINLALTSALFWRQVQGDKVLFFQIDSVLCSNSPYKLSEFLQYDFIGAPWAVGGCCNGGLSIRSRSKTLQMLESGYFHYRLYEMNEDGWYTKHLPYFNGYVAPVYVAKKFSVETIYHPRPFAVHKPLVKDIGVENMRRLCLECPEAKAISPYCRSLANRTNIKF